MTELLIFYKEIFTKMYNFTVLAVLPLHVNHKHGAGKSTVVISAASREVIKQGEH